jgi:UDP-3-O-[3-hydroxymyristoyl] glucosamine N-acyltransferase
MKGKVPPTSIPIFTDEPYAAWARVASLFHPVFPVKSGIHPSAVIADDAHIDPSSEIGPLCVIESGVKIGPHCRVGPSATISHGVVIGPHCRIGANASISHAQLGARVYVYPGARIGQEGFGFASTPKGFVTVPQLGRVIIEDDVEVGATMM